MTCERFGAYQVRDLTGVSYACIRRWSQAGLLGEEHAEAPHIGRWGRPSGDTSRYTAEDVAAIRVVARVRDAMGRAQPYGVYRVAVEQMRAGAHTVTLPRGQHIDVSDLVGDLTHAAR